MRSLLISGHYFPPQTGGISNMMAAIAETLGPARVCCLTGVSASDGSSSPFPLYRRPGAFSKSKPVEAVALGLALVEIAAKHHPQGVLLASVEEGYLGLFLKRYFGLPYVLYVHGNEVAALAMRATPWDKPSKALTEAKKVLAVSAFTADLAGRAGVAAEKIEVLHPGCDSTFFHPRQPDNWLRERLLGKGRGGPVILTVGNLVERKGHDVVIKSIPRLLRELDDVTYLIVGDGPFRDQLQRLSVDLGVDRHVVFAGQVPRGLLPDIYALSNLFVMLSRHRVDEGDVEGFGLVFLEAGACGKPVIGGRSGGIPDAIEDGTTGFVVNPHDVDAIADRIRWLIVNPSAASQMGNHARQRVLEQFSWELVGEKVIAALT
jgi:phosphatidylinositol alpha-1,6-mannosyltransferase